LDVHNEWAEGFSNFIKELMNQREKLVMNFFREQLPDESEFDEVISAYHFKLKNIVESNI
jgi:hypothetical protein